MVMLALLALIGLGCVAAVVVLILWLVRRTRPQH